MVRSRTTFLWVCLSLLELGQESRGGEPPGANVTEGRRVEILAEIAGQASSAERLWAYVRKWREEKAKGYSTERARPASGSITREPGPKSASWKKYQEITNALEEQRIAVYEACREFVRKYPADPRSWDARLLRLEEERGRIISEQEDRALCEQIIAAPDADAATRGRARKHLLLQVIGKYWDHPEDSEKVFAAYEKDYPGDSVGAYLVWKRLEFYFEEKPEEVETMLSQLVASANKTTAEAAGRELSLRTKPLDLKLTATDGKTVDLAKLRGKVVMLYFWATWGDPDRNILPKVQTLRRKYGTNEFQIIGISLDDDRAWMRKAIKAHGINWPNINDTKPNEGSAIATRFSNASPQTVWLLDRKGVAKHLPRGADLDSEVRKRVKNAQP